MSIAVSIMIEGQNGLNWTRWQKIADAVENLGFAGLFRSDHFTNPEPPELDSLEAWVSLTYLADQTQRIHFGPLVSPVSFRDPIMMARQAIAIDDLSGGRFILGVGAGWQEREHRMFGYDLGDVPTRTRRFEEALQVIHLLLTSDSSVSFDGYFYKLREAILLPRPSIVGGPPILVGGNGKKKTLPLAAKYARVWNGVWLSPEDFKDRSETLDELLAREGRSPQDVRRTMMTNLLFAADDKELDQKIADLKRTRSELSNLSTLEAVRQIQKQNWIAGTPDLVLEQLQAYEEAGLQEIMLQWWDFDHPERLQPFAETVLQPITR
ncbi:Luciferase-like monooxygenase [Thermobaculum terrenum ATCC BAA-798]|uniref:Luciferase-like monooxygenase n=1 Tax=Thermobaculum terrenum (strain ATCC BAA-798 / CCMEE 7001 / YNP1) TaxID=525904 RepID=D1CEL9_THET1|nr:TIGR03560 family F420-dependent LLM class oxidoreductase [Thermobaculum terrenum]ACZ41375.1 Luciferase-like monooxygenase [Thermobaculum terrenum ATCC BAA-798]